MRLRKSIVRTKKIFQKTIHDLRSLFFGGYQKLPKPPILNPFSCTRSKTRNNLRTSEEQYYTDFCNEWENVLERERKRREENGIMVGSKEEISHEEEDALKNKQEEGKKQEKMTIQNTHQKEMKGEGGYALAQKMKQLDMMEIGDVEHVLDVEEALHYYSRLRSPVYLDIVDKFFLDMYSEFNTVPQASVGVKKSKQRLGSIRL